MPFPPFKTKLDPERRALLLELHAFLRTVETDQGNAYPYPLYLERKGRHYRLQRDPAELSDEELLWCHYRLGFANLYVFRALDRLLDHLETKWKGAPRAR